MRWGGVGAAGEVLRVGLRRRCGRVVVVAAGEVLLVEFGLRCGRVVVVAAGEVLLVEFGRRRGRLSLIHIPEPSTLRRISYGVFGFREKT